MDPGAAASLNGLYRRYSGWLGRRLRGRVGADEAADVVQETYLRLAPYLIEDIRHPKALLLRVALNLVRDERRRMALRDRAMQGAIPMWVTAADAPVDRLHLKQVLLTMPPLYRDVFVLSRFDAWLRLNGGWPRLSSTAWPNWTSKARTMTADNDLDVRRREAASWFATLNQKRVAASDITAFSQWRRTPANAEAYARIETMWEAAGSLKGDADIAALTAGARARADASRKMQGRLAKGLIPIGALAAVAAVVVGVTLWSARPLSYETGLGERRIVVLADGSKVTLDTESRIT
ncbi:hypothetical protein LTR94_026358, partial [Friedmanniomyces endolithicus]